MKNIVILNRFPLDKIFYHEWVEPGDRIYLFSNRQPQELGAPYHEVRFYDNYDSSNQVMLDVIELAEGVSIDSIIALSEKDVLRAGHLRHHLGVPGLDLETSWRFRDKVAMKDALREAGVPTASYAPIASVTDVLAFMKQNGSRIVIKPRRDAGSRGVSLLDGREEIHRYLEQAAHLSPNEAANWMVESRIDGDMYHVDGVYCAGEQVAAFPSKYMSSCLDFASSGALLSVLVDKTDRNLANLLDVTARAVHALAGDNGTCLYHAELFVTANGEVLVNEVACRIGGAKIYPTVQKICQYDLMREYVRAETGRSPKPQPVDYELGGYLLIPPKKGTVLRLPSERKESWVVECEFHCRVGQVLNPAKSSVDRVLAGVVSGTDMRESEERLRDMVRWFDENSEIREAVEDHETNGI
ncbi:MAG: ATP-grasp domain-containing protein [Tumebacillaceae bacterium]